MRRPSELLRLVRADIHFDALCEQALQAIANFGGQIWTDTGEHDPGVTFIEGYSYSTSDLSYRHTLPLADLLTPSVDEQLPGGGLFPVDFGPQTALTCGPITPADYRRALLDLTDPQETYYLYRDVQLIALDSDDPASANCFDYIYYYDPESLEFGFTKEGASAVTYCLRGDYALYLEPTRESAANSAEAQQVLGAFLTDYRNLCECISKIVVAQPVKINPIADIQIEEGAQDYARIYADIYTATEAYISPTVDHESTAALQQQGFATEDIYDGPYLLHGWQPQLPAATDYTNTVYVNLSGLAQKWMQIEGVKSILSLREYSDPPSGSGMWTWNTAGPNRYPQTWGDDPIGTLVQSVRLITADGKIVVCSKDDIEAQLPAVVIQRNPPVVLPYGKARNLSQYHPVTDRMPACYGLQLPIGYGGPQPLYQYLLPFEQAMANGCRQLAMLPALLSFIRDGDTVWGAQWPYADGSAGDSAHAAYKNLLVDQITSSAEDYDQELNVVNFLLGYFGTQRASQMLDTSQDEFLQVEQDYLAEVTSLAYRRANIRVDRVSALQKRIAARMGWGETLFSHPVEMGRLPFYLVEHRSLLPAKPSAAYDTPVYPTAVDLSEDGRTLTVTCPATPSLSDLQSGDLIDFRLYPESNGMTLQGLIVDKVDAASQSFTLQLAANPPLAARVSAVLEAQEDHALYWQNCQAWLREIVYPLTYAADTPDPPVAPVVLTIASSFPFPAGVREGDLLSIDAISGPDGTSWSMKVLVKQVDGIAGTLEVIPAAGETGAFPSPADAGGYTWHTLSIADRFSMVVSLVLNKGMLPQGGDPDATESWIKQCVQAELPAHIALMIHWLSSDPHDPQSFASFALSYAVWQGTKTAPSTATFQLLWKLGLGRVPAALDVGIGAMIIAKPEQQTEVIGASGDEWNVDVIVENSLFFVPKNDSLPPADGIKE
ncbi:hypothetical protein QYH69_20345 [Paraburkholderia sp. SARCC-3016]|uniref:hypothetical protein n=1 Tax=Paraburkholderia sp. SARCC-3016 TaxID=3058611 RepID=UPI0028073EA5|nr:hypothetical protein [Paraburkholderia sp. SARCC-3016]MDQ7979597.1 hypothetical protein [Paraburkholderia sp. SARCC-3016]